MRVLEQTPRRRDKHEAEQEMKITRSLGLVVGVLALSACQNGIPGFGGGGNDLAAAGTETGINGLGPDGVISENSIAFFNTTVGDRILFVVDQSTLTPEAISVLDGQANWMVANPQYTARIEGHADEQGTREYNLGLGSKRASAVANYLISRGVAANRLETVTFGKERPLAICSDESCWSQNRRAQTVVAGGLGS